MIKDLRYFVGIKRLHDDLRVNTAQVQDYALWDVIENGNSFVPVTQTTTAEDGAITTTISSLVTAKEKIKKKNDVKARSMLLMALPNEHLMTFNQYKDAKSLFAAIKTRFGGNEATKKTQKTLLKQIYENFSATSTKSLDSIFNRLQKISYMADDEAPTNMALMAFQTQSYLAVLPPPTGLFSPPKLDLSNSGLEDFKQLELQSYGPKSCEKESKNASEDIPNEPKEYPDAPLAKDRVSDNKDCSVESPKVLEKKTDVPTIAKVEVVRLKQQEKLVRKTVKYAEMYRSQVNTARPRPVNTIRSVNTARPRPFNTARPRLVNTDRPNSTGHPQKEDQGYVDSGCSRHMIGNMSYLSYFKEFDRGYVTFGGGVNSGRVTGKGTLKTSKLDFEDVYFVKELKFNLLSVSQIVDMRNIVPKESLTCLVSKATLDESMLWHMRLGHINFKNINKLVKDNLVRGLPSKHFKNDQTYVACLKGKQHKASSKSKVQNSISQPLFMLQMDLFGLTFMSRLMHKKYELVVTDDYSRYTWVFFLASKDETLGILKKFITEIENLVDKKVKVIRCDNGTEFKNSVMNDFCAMKGIRREFSVARTPQQNGIAERRNKTLIKAARTMALVVKPHNKTSYELFRGRTHALSFMRPFGCHVTIFNTLDHLGKFDGKADEGYFVGYSMNSTNSGDFASTKDSIDGSPLFDSSPNLSDDAGLPSSDDPNMPGLETIATNDDFEEEADFTNLESSIHVSLTPTTRTHKDHPLRQISHMDVKSAFLYGKIEEEVYVCQPPGFEYPDHIDKIYKVVKALYCLHQAPRAWYETLANYLLGNGFHRGKIDHTLFIKRQKGDILLVHVYADDIIFGSTKKELCNELERLMKDKFQMSSMGELTFFLRLLTITLNRLERSIHWDPQVVSEHVENSESLPSSWSQVSLIMRTKPGVDTLNFDDLHNNIRVFESDDKGSTGSSSSTQIVTFVSSDNTSSTNEVNTAYGVSTSSGHNSQKDGSSS
uniref:Integrase catalytic domain-containing protein n=1 Tax=Tanacetum cinerariifolium TaxID=118510 RepID=A0A6L2KE15_TANCI|nr:hypothetical protein [Tanacetum cinerariifolium]